MSCPALSRAELFGLIQPYRALQRDYDELTRELEGLQVELSDEFRTVDLMHLTQLASPEFVNEEDTSPNRVEDRSLHMTEHGQRHGMQDPGEDFSRAEAETILEEIRAWTHSTVFPKNTIVSSTDNCATKNGKKTTR